MIADRPATVAVPRVSPHAVSDDAVWCPTCKEPTATRVVSRITCPCGHDGHALNMEVSR